MLNEKEKEYIEKEYLHLKNVIGEDKAKRYIDTEKNVYGFKAIGFQFLIADLKKLKKEKPLRFTLVVIVILAIPTYYIGDMFLWW